jgi:hypothetical protein
MKWKNVFIKLINNFLKFCFQHNNIITQIPNLLNKCCKHILIKHLLFSAYLNDNLFLQYIYH